MSPHLFLSLPPPRGPSFLSDCKQTVWLYVPWLVTHWRKDGKVGREEGREGEGGWNQRRNERSVYFSMQREQISCCIDMLSRWGGGWVFQQKRKSRKTNHIMLCLYTAASYHISARVPHSAAMIRLHTRRGLCASASTHRLKNHSETLNKVAPVGHGPLHLCHTRRETWDHKGCWDCCRAPTVYWHFTQNEAEGDGGGEWVHKKQLACKSGCCLVFTVKNYVECCFMLFWQQKKKQFGGANRENSVVYLTISTFRHFWMNGLFQHTWQMCNCMNSLFFI